MPRQNKINTLYVFTVEGSGEFPFDMLRYDTCWPEHETDTPMMGRGWSGRAKRSVRMIGLRTPTVGRWLSFGWVVKDGSVQDRSVG